MSCATEMPVEAEQRRAGAQASAADELPVTVIQRQSGWRWLNLGELWRFRELLFFLSWRDLKVRYKQTVLGASWAVLQPLATMLVFSLFLGRIPGLYDGATPYSLFVFAGLVPWTFFANAISSASQSIVGNERLVTKIYFPRLIIPMATVGAAVVDFLIAGAVLAAMMLGYALAGYHVSTGWSLLLVPVISLGLAVAALGVGTLLSALTVAYRDFRYVVPFAVQLWMFATPCIYLVPEAALGPTAKAVMPINPAYGLIAGFRTAMFGGPIDTYSLTVSAAVSILLLIVGCCYFKRVERSFADII
jgi:lipopolysaccharide transport system permease protein